MPAPAGIFAHPVAGLDQRRHNRWNVARVDQVVEGDGEIGVGDEILAIMDDDQGIGPSRRIAGGQIDPLLAALSKRRALDLHGFDAPGGSATRLTPLGARVAIGPALRILTERIASPRRVERIQDPFLAAVPPDRQLVLEPTAVRDRQAQQPKVGPRHPLEAGAVAARMDPSQNVDMVGRAPPGEGRRPRLNEREFVVRQEIVHSRWCGLAIGQQLRDLRMPPYWRCLIGAHPAQAGSVECSCTSQSRLDKEIAAGRCRTDCYRLGQSGRELPPRLQLGGAGLADMSGPSGCTDWATSQSTTATCASWSLAPAASAS